MAGAVVNDGGRGLSVSLIPRCHGCSHASCGCRGRVVEFWCLLRCLSVVVGWWGFGHAGWLDVWVCVKATWCVWGDDDVGPKDLECSSAITVVVVRRNVPFGEDFLS